jgi:hypothetical protein
MPPGGALDIPLFLLVLTAPAMACEPNDGRVWYTDEENDQKPETDVRAQLCLQVGTSQPFTTASDRW